MFIFPLAAAATCLLTAASPQPVQTLSVTVDGVKRSADVVVSPKARARLSQKSKVPLVYVWHGFGGSPDGMRRAFAPVLDGAISVFPQGLGRTFPGFGRKARPGWQIKANDLQTRDLKFFDALQKRLLASGCVDDKRVSSTGFSNGALFTNVLGCYRPTQLSAIALVSGAGPGADASCLAPVPTLVVHGTKDRVLPFAKGESTAQKWSEVNKCQQVVSRPAAGTCTSAVGCKAPLHFCAHGHGHTVPASTRTSVATFLLSDDTPPQGPITAPPK